MSLRLFESVSHQCSRLTTEAYSTSFASAIRLLHADIREPIYNIYAFVRFADEIVDTFHAFDKPLLLSKFKNETYEAIEQQISLNPILQSFQLTVNRYRIDAALIESFFKSMEMDLYNGTCNERQYIEYIYGSAEVVGLMCLQVFCEGDRKRYAELEPYARALGAAFQKVNFLRDMKADYISLSRCYFPGVDFMNFDENNKREIVDDINSDFRMAYKGIVSLPWKVRFGVYVAYKYYLSLFNKIKRTQAANIVRQRIRIPNFQKAMILAKAGIRSQLKLI